MAACLEEVVLPLLRVLSQAVCSSWAPLSKTLAAGALRVRWDEAFSAVEAVAPLLPFVPLLFPLVSKRCTSPVRSWPPFFVAVEPRPERESCRDYLAGRGGVPAKPLYFVGLGECRLWV